MSAGAGRRVILSVAGTPIAACKTKSLKINREVIDISSDDDGAWKKLLSGDLSSKSVEISCDGIAKNITLLTSALTTDTELALTMEFPGLAEELSGNFMMTAYELGAPSGDAVTFSATFSSSGEVTGASA